MSDAAPQWPAGGHAGWVALGAMGYHMAGHVARVINQAGGGAKLSVWNRTVTKSAAHAAEFGSNTVSHVEDLASCRVIISCLPTSEEVSAVTSIVAAARQNLIGHAQLQECVWVDCSSGDPERTREIARQLAPSGITLVDCPVSGGPRGAVKGTVTCMYGGDLGPALPLVSSFGGKVENVGPVGAGMAVKAINNALNTAHLILGAEALLALKGMGVDPAKALSVINTSSGRSLQTEVRIPEEVLTRRFGYGFQLGLMKKDVDHATSLLKTGFPGARLLPQVSGVLREAVEARGPEVDYTEVVTVLEQEFGDELLPDSNKS